MLNVLVFLCSYLICAINPAIVISKKVIGTDIRNVGSGNAGTTNAMRTMGKGWGIVVFVLDALKVVIAYGVTMLLCNMFKGSNVVTAESIYIVAAIVGHCYPIYYNFQGGKGVVAILISCAFLEPKTTLVCLIVAIIIIFVSRMVSMGSLSAVVLFNIMIMVMEPKYLFGVMIASAIIIYKHRTNIKRIMNGEENKLF